MKASIPLPVPADERKKRQHQITEKIKVLLEKQQTPKSFLSKIAAHYVSYSWWIKWGLAALCAMVGGGIAFFTAPFLFPWASIAGAIIAFIGYFIPTTILKNHHQADVAYQQKLADEIVSMENVLNESINAIQSLEQPMQTLIQSLDVKNKERGHANKLFQASVDSFKQQTDHAEQMMQSLNDTQAEMRHRNLSLSEVIADSSEAHQQLSATQIEIEQINHALDNTKNGLQKEADTFHNIVERLEKNNQALVTFQHQLKEIEKRAEITQAMFEKQRDMLAQSLEETSRYPEESEKEKNESTEALQDETLANLERFIHLRKKQGFFKEGNLDDADIVQIPPLHT